MNTIFFILTSYNRVSKTQACINSIYQAKSSGFKKEIILVDDNSEDSTSKLQHEFPSIKYFKTQGDEFWGGGTQIGLDKALEVGCPNDWFFLLNTDAECAQDILENFFIRHSERTEDFIVSATALDLKDRKTIVKSGTKYLSWFLNVSHHFYVKKDINKLKEHTNMNCDLLTGRAIIGKLSLIRRFGGLNTRLFKHYCGDDEFTARMKKNGVNLYMDTSLIVYIDMATTGLKIGLKNLTLNLFKNHFFGIRSPYNIRNKFYLTLEIVPFYAKPTFFLVAVIKSVAGLLRN